MPHDTGAPVGQLQILHHGKKRLDFDLHGLRQKLPQNIGQWIIHIVGLTKGNNIASLVHGVSLSLRGSGRLDTRLDTPPLSIRHDPLSRIAQGATENAAAVQAILDNLVACGLDPKQPRLFVLDGAKALSKAVKATFGRTTPIHAVRCTRRAISPSAPRRSMLPASAEHRARRGSWMMPMKRSAASLSAAHPAGRLRQILSALTAALQAAPA